MIYNLVEEVKKHEGLRLRMYRCIKGFFTIGWGHNLVTTPLCVEACEVQLQYDLKTTATRLSKRLLSFNSYPKNVQNFLVELAFCVGVDGCLAFEDMIDALDKKDYSGAIVEFWDSKMGRKKMYRGRMKDMEKALLHAED